MCTSCTRLSSKLSKDRADFVSRLFSRKRPKGLTEKSTAAQLFGAYLSADGNKEMFEENLQAIEDILVNKHKFPLTAGDLEGIRWALSNYYLFGPAINYNSSLREIFHPVSSERVAGDLSGTTV